MLFRLRDVTKTYGEIAALRQLTVEVPAGAVGLLGPNGAGKTTLIRALLGLIFLDSGSGEVFGLDIRSRQLDIRQAVGFVPEDECLFPGLPGVEFVAYAGQHPHRIVLVSAHFRALAARLVGCEDVEGVRFLPAQSALLVETRQPDAFYARLPGLALEDGLAIQEVYSEDDNLEAVFKYLVSP